MGHGSPKLSCKGEDLLVVLVGQDKIPVAKVIKSSRLLILKKSMGNKLQFSYGTKTFRGFQEG